MKTNESILNFMKRINGDKNSICLINNLTTGEHFDMYLHDVKSVVFDDFDTFANPAPFFPFGTTVTAYVITNNKVIINTIDIEEENSKACELEAILADELEYQRTIYD